VAAGRRVRRRRGTPFRPVRRQNNRLINLEMRSSSWRAEATKFNWLISSRDKFIVAQESALANDRHWPATNLARPQAGPPIESGRHCRPGFIVGVLTFGAGLCRCEKLVPAASASAPPSRGPGAPGAGQKLASDGGALGADHQSHASVSTQIFSPLLAHECWACLCAARGWRGSRAIWRAGRRKAGGFHREPMAAASRRDDLDTRRRAPFKLAPGAMINTIAKSHAPSGFGRL
jgi:hypothetical protein